MRRLNIIFLPFLLLSTITFSQTITLEKKVDLTNINDGEFYFPKFSQDGTKIFFTTDNYKGLFLYDLKTKFIKILNNETGAGYEFNAANTGNLVFYRSDKYINGRKYSTLKSMDINTGIVENIVSDKRDLSTPRYIGNNKIVYSVENNLNVISANKTLKKSSIAIMDKPFALIENSKIALYIGGKKKILAPLGNKNYIWPSVSPDNSKLLFTCAGEGTFVADLNGNIISRLGYANYPKWSPDGKWISFMVDKDDGYRVTSSDIYIASWDGQKKFSITDTKDVYEMYPEWAPSGNQLVVNTYDGVIQLLTLNFSK